MKILDRELGARKRAILSVTTMIIGALTMITETLDAIPDVTPIGAAILSLGVALIQYLGRLTKFGDIKNV